MNPEFVQKYAEKMARDGGHPVSLQEAEAEIVATILRVAHEHSRKRKFGYFESEDIEQEAAIFGLDLIAKGKYDVSRPLDKYLHTHIKRRLHNLKRDRYLRPEPPCSCCDLFNPPAEPCRRWLAWDKRNSAKRDLNSTGMEVPVFKDPAARKDRDLALVAEIEAFVDETYPPEVRQDYLRLKAGAELTRSRRAAVLEPIRRRFGDAI